MDRRRAVVTGLGVIAATGSTPDAFWDGLMTPVAPGPRPVRDFDPAPLFDSPKEARRRDRFSQFALAAALDAVTTAGLDSVTPDAATRIGVVIATGVGGIGTTEDNVLTLHERGARRVTPFLIPMMMPNAAAAAVSMRHGFTGPCECIVTACAAGTHALGAGLRLIRDGSCDVVIAGGSEAAMTPIGTCGFNNLTATSSSGRSRPFDVDRDGFVMSEGAGVLVIEELEHAQARGAPILAELAGAASTADAHHITAPDPEGSGAVRCMRNALADAGIEPAEVGHINAHGTSTPLNDAAEANAIKITFGDGPPPVTSIKGATGHSLGAAGAVEAVAAVLSIQRNLIPPTLGTANIDPEVKPLDVVLGEARPWTPGPVLSNSFGFGGHNGCVVITPPPAER